MKGAFQETGAPRLRKALGLVVTYVLGPSIYAAKFSVGTSPADHYPLPMTLGVADVLATILVFVRGVMRRWRWLFWLLVVLLGGNALSLLAGTLLLLLAAGVLPIGGGPLWYNIYEMVAGMIEAGLAVWMLVSWRPGRRKEGIGGAKLTLKGDAPKVGLRERKKAKTRATIREHALRLVREQGYVATTVEQIAEAAEVSPSTFFRYFPTKEDAVLYDPYDPLLIRAFRAQPEELGPLEAMRAALREVFSVPPEEAARVRELSALVLSVPELRARMLDELARSARMAAELAAERAGRPADDFAARTFAGAVVGAMTAVLIAAAEDPEADPVALVDEAMAHLEAGLPL